MLLIYPPIAKPCEAPAGIAFLAGTLQKHGHHCDLVDLNIEGITYLLYSATGKDDTWSKRSLKNRDRNITALRSRSLYNNPSQYQKAVLELNRLLECGTTSTTTLSLSNYQDSNLSPTNSLDLLSIAENPEKCVFYSFFMDRLHQLFKKRVPNHIGISLNYLSQALSTFALIGCIKKLLPDVAIVVGGGLMTTWMRNPLWNNPFSGWIDRCIAGCGELPLLHLLGTKKKIDSLPDFAQLTLPDFAQLRDNSYFSPGFILPYNTSTGCFWNKCNFCPEKAEGNAFQKKSSDKVIGDIVQLQKETQPVLLHFLDNAIPPDTLKRIMHEDLKIPWYGFARITNHLLDLDFCMQLKRSGCVMLKLGIESGNQNVLDQMQKGLEISTISKVLQNLKDAGIATYVYLLFGTPAESYNEAVDTMEFVLVHHEAITFLNLAIFNLPIIGSDSQSLQTTSFYSGDLSLYTDFEHPLEWHRIHVRRFLDQKFKKQTQIAAILRRDPPIFTSNHAPFFASLR